MLLLLLPVVVVVVVLLVVVVAAPPASDVVVKWPWPQRGQRDGISVVGDSDDCVNLHIGF